MAEARETEAGSERIDRALRTVVVLFLLGVFSFVVWQSGQFMLGARLFPEYVGIAGIGLCLLELARQAWRRTRADTPTELDTADLAVEADERTAAGYARALRLFGWILIYYALIWLAGMMVATSLFVPALLLIRFRAPWLPSLAIAAGLIVLIWLLGRLIMLRWPGGVLPLPF
jgi:hypothetical protein